jgi:hypothetical protein
MVEKNLNQKILNPEEQKKLSSVRKEFQKKDEKFIEAVSLISEETVGKLKNVLEFSYKEPINEGEDEDTDVDDNSYYNAYGIADDYMHDFSADKVGAGTNSLPYQVERWLRMSFPRGNNLDFYSNPQDAATVGFFLVFKAFHIQLGERLIDNLRNASPKEVMQTFDLLGPRVANSASIAERSINKISVPEDQVFFSKFMGDFLKVYEGGAKQQIEAGAILGFKVIEKLWPKLAEKPKKT